MARHLGHVGGAAPGPPADASDGAGSFDSSRARARRRVSRCPETYGDDEYGTGRPRRWKRKDGRPLQHRSARRCSPSGCWRRGRDARWTAAGGAWTDRRLWRTLKYEAVYLHEWPMRFDRAGRDLRSTARIGGRRRPSRRGACSVNIRGAALWTPDRSRWSRSSRAKAAGSARRRTADGADKPSPSVCGLPASAPLRYGATRKGKPAEGGPLRAPHVRHRAGAQRARPRPRTRSARHRGVLGFGPKTLSRGAREIRSGPGLVT